MTNILFYLYLADVYKSAVDLITFIGWLVIPISAVMVLIHFTADKRQTLFGYSPKPYLVLFILSLFLLSAFSVLTPSPKLVERACYVGVAYETGKLISENIPDSVKTKMKEGATEAMYQSITLPSNVLGLMNVYTQNKIKELEASVIEEIEPKKEK